MRARQAALARNHGIDGFLYYHYWFGGRRVLNRPIDEVLRPGSTDMPFALCWVNENWTGVWDSSEQLVLVEHTYDATEPAQHMDFLVKVFHDPRYIKRGCVRC